MPCVSLQKKRDYAAHLSRWISTDSAGLVDGVNLYAYVNGNPFRLNDPSGTSEENVVDYENRTEDSTQYYGGRGFNLPPYPDGFNPRNNLQADGVYSIGKESERKTSQVGWQDGQTDACFDNAEKAVLDAVSVMNDGKRTGASCVDGSRYQITQVRMWKEIRSKEHKSSKGVWGKKW